MSEDIDFDELFTINEVEAPKTVSGAAISELPERIDPIEASDRIGADYRRYLKTFLSPRDPKIADAFNAAIENSQSFIQGPFLQISPPFKAGKSPNELISEGVLHSDFVGLGDAIPLSRPFYLHQEKAIRKLKAGRNLVVSTGTGSGKTESFLIPIINELLSQRAAGRLGPGVRALLLYPMNALANDQVERIRELLKNFPEITFGRYTGETEQSKKDALGQYLAEHGSTPLDNELISREQMQETPPHILLTNYAMLEYLLLRPSDTVLFDGANANEWRFLVLDEAHVYGGAQGAEVAMLLRRLKDRVNRGKPMQHIATSASLEGGANRVMSFASSLFNAAFEADEADPERLDLVQAEHSDLSRTPTWTLSSVELAEKPVSELREIVARTAHNNTDQSEYNAMLCEENLNKLRALLSNGSQPLSYIAAELWPSEERDVAMALVHKLVSLASEVSSESKAPALAARYHLFVRSTEGAFLGFDSSGEPEIYLSRQLSTKEGHPVYEFGTCQRCGAVHLRGENLGNCFQTTQDDSPATSASWLVLTHSEAQSDIDEDDQVQSDSPEYTDANALHKLCTCCGKLMSAKATQCDEDRCSQTELLSVRYLKDKSLTRSQCTECGHASNDVVRRLITDQFAAPAVLTTSLYQLLPPEKNADYSASGGGRKLLTFSDSRQAAAASAPYLESTYNELLERRILIEALAGTENEPVLIDDLIDRIKMVGRNANLSIFKDADSHKSISIAGSWIFSELTTDKKRTSIEGLGLARVAIRNEVREEVAKEITAVSKMLGSDEVAWACVELLLQTVRGRSAISSPREVNRNDFRFEPRQGSWAFRKSGGGSSKNKLFSWFPAKNTNARVQLMQKLIATANKPKFPPTKENAETILDYVWEKILKRSGILVMRTDTKSPNGNDLVLDYRVLEVSLAKPEETWECDICRRVTAFNVLNQCPAHSCDGTLHQIDLNAPRHMENHYRNLARGLEIIEMNAEEHTAQLQTNEGARIQKQFINGEINVLSCSTTFELGVDVGGLQSVVLRNVPPGTANYVQRAGRAGRRAGSAAFVLTFAKRAPHDLSMFNNPKQMIDGVMLTPYLNVENPRIAVRHAFSVIFAEFLRQKHSFWPNWNKVGGLLVTDETDVNINDELAKFIKSLPPKVMDSLRRVLPVSVHAEVQLETGELMQEFLDSFQQVTSQLNDDIKLLTQLADAASSKRSHSQAGGYEKTAATIRKQSTLNFMATKNLLPKYGFPVDTVTLDTSFAASGATIKLDRDLKLAIGEFAPGSKVVAAKELWSSAGLRTMFGRQLEVFDLVTCLVCNHKKQVYEGADIRECEGCGADLNSVDSGARAKRDTFVVPRFGFIANRESEQFTTVPAKSYWKRDEHIVSYGREVGSTLEWEHNERKLRLQAFSHAELTILNNNDFTYDLTYRKGFDYCPSCGFLSEPNSSRDKPHTNPRTQKPCFERVRPQMALGHTFQTDVATIAVQNMNSDAPEASWQAALYALIESASEKLEINRRDIGGMVNKQGATYTLVLSDEVPGGAGFTSRILENFDLVLDRAIERVENCSCGEDTSCYSCLRSYSNQFIHRLLRRKDAVADLKKLQDLRLTAVS